MICKEVLWKQCKYTQFGVKRVSFVILHFPESKHTFLIIWRHQHIGKDRMTFRYQIAWVCIFYSAYDENLYQLSLVFSLCLISWSIGLTLSFSAVTKAIYLSIYSTACGNSVNRLQQRASLGSILVFECASLFLEFFLVHYGV